MTMKIQTAFVLIAAVTSAAAMGCGSSSDKPSSTGTSRVSLHRAKGCGDLLSDLKADAVFKLNKGIDLQIESIQKCVARTGDDASCAYGGYVGGYGYGGGGFAEGDSTGALPPGAPVPAAGAPATNGGTSGGTSASSAPTDRATSHSDTNNQVKGVDEADFVKTDGKNLYVIHGSAFKVLQAWPANDLKELSSLDIEGIPTEMFVDSGKAVVYSQVNGASLYTATGVTPKDSYQDFAYATGGVAYASGGADVGAPVGVSPPAPGGTTQPQQYVPLTKITVLTLDAAGTPSVAREMYFEGSYLDSRRVGTHVRTVLSGDAHGPKLKYSVYDLYPQPVYNGTGVAPSGPDSPPTKDGTATGTDPGTAPGGTPPSTTNPPAPANPYPQTGTAMIAALEQLRASDLAAIDASQLSDWMPYTFTKNGGAVSVSSVACEDFYVPSTGSTESGLTEVASIDLANPNALARESAILGRAETVYGSEDTIYLAAQAWVEMPYAWTDGPTAGGVSGSGSTGSGTVMAGTTTASPPPAPPPSPTPAGANIGTRTLRPRDATSSKPISVTAWATNKTHLHKFEFATDPSFPNYVASGTVVGNIKDQFSLDDKDGYLRVATSESRMYLDQDGKYLQPTFPGDTSGAQDRPSNVNHVFTLGVNGGWLDLAGDVGELAPNEQIDSVRFVDGRGYVVTFRRVDPLFVIDLTNPNAPSKVAELTIPGFSEYMHPLDATHLMTIGRAADASGHVQGLQLQIFDVSNATNPVVAQKFTYSNVEYGYSDAESDHKAFTYFADQGMLAFPYYGYTPNSSSPDGGMHSSLEIFKVDVASGFSKLGSIDHTKLLASYPGGYCGGYYGPQVRRGVFLDNFVYSISYGGVIAKDANNLAGAGSELALPAPQINDGYGYGAPCAEPATAGGGTATGTAGAPTPAPAQ
jgi:uncharacterized secreted protein with C-terminal beta-propeller domain